MNAWNGEREGEIPWSCRRSKDPSCTAWTFCGYGNMTDASLENQSVAKEVKVMQGDLGNQSSAHRFVLVAVSLATRMSNSFKLQLLLFLGQILYLLTFHRSPKVWHCSFILNGKFWY